MAGYTLTIEAIDKATAKLEAINKKLASMSAPVSNLQKSIQRFSKVSGITGAFDKIGGAIRGAFSALTKFVPLLGTLTAGGIVAGIAAITREWSEYELQLRNTSKFLGLMPSQLQTLQNANKLLGGSAEGATAAYEQFDTALQDALVGRNDAMRNRLITLGIGFQKVGFQAKSAAEVLPQVWQKAQDMAAGGASAATLRTAFAGILTPEQLVEATKQGAQGGAAAYARLTAEAKRYDVLSEKEKNDFAEQGGMWRRLGLAVDAFKQRIAVGLLPVINPLIEKLTVWLMNTDNVNWAIDNLKQAILFIQHVIKDLWPKVDSVVQAFGGWKRVIEGIIALKMVGFVLNLLSPLASLTKAIYTASTASGLLNTNLSAMAGNPAIRTLMVLLQLWDKAKEGTPVTPEAIAPNSPFFKDLTPEQQEQSRKLHEGGASDSVGGWWKNHAPTWLGGKSSDAGAGASKVADLALSGDAVAQTTQMLHKFEGMQSTGTWDVNAFRAGYGSDTKTDPTTGEITKITQGMRVSRAEADADLKRRIETEFMPKAAKAIGAEAWARLTPQQQAAITSVTYNYGHTPDGIVTAAQSGNADAIGKSIDDLSSANGGINARRRHQEAQAARMAPPLSLASSKLPPVKGAVQIDINHNNAPAGSSVTASASGAASTPRVVQPMASYA